MKNNKLKKTLLRVLAEEQQKKGIDRFQKILFEREKWLKDNRPKRAEILDETIKKYVEVRLEDIENNLKLNQRQADFHPDYTKQVFEKHGDKQIQEQLKKFKISYVEFFDIAADEPGKRQFKSGGFGGSTHLCNYIYRQILKNLKSEGFNILKEDISDIQIGWDIPDYYGKDLSKIDWEELYKAYQTSLFQHNMFEKFCGSFEIECKNCDGQEDSCNCEEFVAKEETPEEKSNREQLAKKVDVHYRLNDKAKDNVLEILKEYNLQKNDIFKPYSAKLNDWRDDVCTVENLGKEEPPYFLKLKRPESLKNVGVDE